MAGERFHNCVCLIKSTPTFSSLHHVNGSPLFYLLQPMRQAKTARKPFARKNPTAIIFVVIFLPAIFFGLLATLSFRFEEQHRRERLASIKPDQFAVYKSNQASEGTVCFQLLQDGCQLTGCQPSLSRQRTHLRGLVKEIDQPGTVSLKTNQSCGVCGQYLRQCAVSVDHKFIYIHVMKSGGSSFHRFLKHAFCRRNEMLLQQPGKKIPEFICRESSFQLMPCESAIAQHPDFFKWSFIRHPIPRAVSSWAMAVKLSNFTDHAAIPFNTWAVDPTVLRTQMWEMHWWPQAAFLMGGGTCPMYDFVGTFGVNFDQDLTTVLQRIDSPSLWRSYRTHGFPKEHQTPPALRDAAYANISTAAMEALVRRYRADFDLFGFEPDAWRGFFD